MDLHKIRGLWYDVKSRNTWFIRTERYAEFYDTPHVMILCTNLVNVEINSSTSVDTG